MQEGIAAILSGHNGIGNAKRTREHHRMITQASSVVKNFHSLLAIAVMTFCWS